MSNKQIPCPYERYGCKFISRSDLELKSHLNEVVQQHVSLLCNYYKTIVEEKKKSKTASIHARERVKRLQQQNSALVAQNTKLRAELSWLQSRQKPQQDSKYYDLTQAKQILRSFLDPQFAAQFTPPASSGLELKLQELRGEIGRLKQVKAQKEKEWARLKEEQNFGVDNESENSIKLPFPLFFSTSRVEPFKYKIASIPTGKSKTFIPTISPVRPFDFKVRPSKSAPLLQAPRLPLPLKARSTSSLIPYSPRTDEEELAWFDHSFNNKILRYEKEPFRGSAIQYKCYKEIRDQIRNEAWEYYLFRDEPDTSQVEIDEMAEKLAIHINGAQDLYTGKQKIPCK